jgi:hypothetical protein
VRLIAWLLILISIAFSFEYLHCQDIQFSREINPFTVTDFSGKPYEMPFIGGYNVPRIQFVDIDYDGDLDLFLQEINDRLSYYENIGSQNEFLFEWRTDDWLGFDHGAWFRFIDMDKDNDLEFFCQGIGTQIRYFESTNRIFTIKTDSLKDVEGNLIFSELTSIPEFYDLDCDGDLDLFLGRQSGTITNYENLSSIKDSIPQFNFVTDSFQDILIIGGGGLSKPTHHGANSLSFGDLNDDQAAELLYGDFFSRSIYYFDHLGTCSETVLGRTFDTFPQNDPLLTGGFNRPQLVDIDGDFDLDLFVTVLGGFYSFTQNVVENIFFYENTGSIESANLSKVTSTFLDQIDVGEESVPVFADIDADGDLDLFIGNQSQPAVSSSRGQLIYYKNIGNGEDPQFQLIDDDFLIVENVYNLSPTFGDLDGDGDLDLLSGRNNGKVIYWENIGDKFNPDFNLISSTYADIDVGAISAPALVDLDLDNDLDLIIGEFSGNLNYYINQGDSTNPVFVLENDFFAEIQTVDYSKPSFSDFDSDADQDLVVGSGSGDIYFYSNDGDDENISFSPIDNPGIKIRPRSSPVLVDLNHNKHFDLISGSQGGGLYYFKNTTASSITRESQLLPESFYVDDAYPNPFNNRTNFKIIIPYQNSLRIEIFNIIGEKINTIFNDKVSSGNYTFSWDGNSDSGLPVSSGLYFVSIHFDSYFHNQKLFLIK